MQPRVSVIVPAYNAGTTLREAVTSVLEQTFEDMECLIINDGSTDNTNDLAKQLASEHSRVSLLAHPERDNQGVAATRNLGLKHARGEFIAFLDADDAWLPSKIEQQLGVMTQYTDVGFVFSDVYISIKPDPSRPMSSQPLDRDPFRGSMSLLFNEGADAAANILNFHPEPYRFIPSPTPLVRRSLMVGKMQFIGPPQLSLQYEDFLMWRILSMRTRFHCIQAPLAIYREHQDSFTGRFRMRCSMVDHLIGLEEVQQFFLDHEAARHDDNWRKAVNEQQKIRLVGGAHRVPWLDLPRMLKVAGKHGVAGQVFHRRFKASVFHARARLVQLRNFLLSSKKGGL